MAPQIGDRLLEALEKIHRDTTAILQRLGSTLGQGGSAPSSMWGEITRRGMSGDISEKAKRPLKKREHYGLYDHEDFYRLSRSHMFGKANQGLGPHLAPDSDLLEDSEPESEPEQEEDWFEKLKKEHYKPKSTEPEPEPEERDLAYDILKELENEAEKEYQRRKSEEDQWRMLDEDQWRMLDEEVASQLNEGDKVNQNRIEDVFADWENKPDHLLTAADYEQLYGTQPSASLEKALQEQEDKHGPDIELDTSEIPSSEIDSKNMSPEVLSLLESAEKSGAFDSIEPDADLTGKSSELGENNQGIEDKLDKSIEVQEKILQELQKNSASSQGPGHKQTDQSTIRQPNSSTPAESSLNIPRLGVGSAPPPRLNRRRPDAPQDMF